MRELEKMKAENQELRSLILHQGASRAMVLDRLETTNAKSSSDISGTPLRNLGYSMPFSILNTQVTNKNYPTTTTGSSGALPSAKSNLTEIQPQLHPRLLSEVSPERFMRTAFTDQGLRQDHMRGCPDCQHATKMILQYQKKIDHHI